MEVEGSPSKFTKAKTTPVIKSVSSLNEELISRRGGEIMPVTSAHSSPQGVVTKAKSGGEVSISSRSRSSTARSVVRPPLIDESLIADDNEGLPLISAVYSLAANSIQDGSEASGIQGISVKGSKLDSSQQSSSQITKTQRVVSPTPSSPHSNRVSADATEVKEASKLKTISESLELNERKTSPRPQDDGERIHPTVANSVTKTHSSANVMQLVKLVDSVHKQMAPTGQSLTSASVNGQSSASVPPTSLASSSLVKPVTQPRQIAMKPQGTSTSIVLNLKPGEALPKAINVLGPDGKTVVVLSLTGDGGKPLSPQVSQTGGRIVIPLPATVSQKQGTVVNKVVSASSGKVPIAPHPGRVTVLSPTSLTSSPLLTSALDSSLLQKAPITRTENGATRTSPSVVISNASEKRPPVIVESQNPESVSQGNCEGSPAVNESYSTTVASPEATPSASTEEKQGGLSPHEARIQRLKELIKAQEEAVNKLREKRRLEIERIRSDSTSSPENEEDAFKPERPPSVEQKSSSSPFAVPLPPKKRFREQDSGVKAKLPKSAESSVISNEGAFIPNGDDKSFVQLVGLENVVNNIK